MVSAVGLSLVTTFNTLTACTLFVIAILLMCVGLRRAGWIGARRIVSVVWLPDGRWRLTDRRGVTAEAVLHGNSRIGSRWIWLRWTDVAQRLPSLSERSLFLTAGDLPEGELRRLIVRLRIEGLMRNTAATELSPT